MKTQIIIATTIILVWIISIPLERKRKQRLEKYWRRSCAGAEWKSMFPNESKDSIREFLKAFVDGFTFKSNQRLKFRPGDKVMDIYRTLYPTLGGADALEVETFFMNLEKRFGFDASTVTNEDVTLGELFKRITHPNNTHSITASGGSV